jgi:hypothetical protein
LFGIRVARRTISLQPKYREKRKSVAENRVEEPALEDVGNPVREFRRREGE